MLVDQVYDPTIKFIKRRQIKNLVKLGLKIAILMSKSILLNARCLNYELRHGRRDSRKVELLGVLGFSFVCVCASGVQVLINTGSRDINDGRELW